MELWTARTTDERSNILRDQFAATKTLEDYKRYAFLKSWEEKDSREVGALLQPDEAASLWKQRHPSK
jgi:hypothetical protein